MASEACFAHPDALMKTFCLKRMQEHHSEFSRLLGEDHLYTIHRAVVRREESDIFKASQISINEMLAGGPVLLHDVMLKALANIL